MPKIVIRISLTDTFSSGVALSCTGTSDSPTSNKTSENIGGSMTLICSVLQRALWCCRDISQEWQVMKTSRSERADSLCFPVYVTGSPGAGEEASEGAAVYKRPLQGRLWEKPTLRIWQNLGRVKRTPLHHSPTRNSSGRATSDILKHLQILRDGAMDLHRLSHRHLNAPYLTEGWFSKTTMAHVFFPDTFGYDIFIIAFPNYPKHRRWY